jgi:peptide-methionine (R)-S-oxide reductase
MQRRIFLQALLGLPLMAEFYRRAVAAAPADMQAVEELRKNWRSLLADGVEVASADSRLERSREEWRKILAPPQFAVLREEDTERPFSSSLNAEKRPGVFVCAGCNLPLFTSAMKYESGTGWPSFFTTIPGAFATKTDYRILLPRTEYHCIRCSGHQGHVFNDGPRPTGERWCNNGVALRFIPKE